MSVSERKFGTLPTGEEVKIYHLENKKGAYAEVLQYGAILVKMCVPDKKGDLKDVVLGYDDIRGYEINGCFFGELGKTKPRTLSLEEVETVSRIPDFLLTIKKWFLQRMRIITIFTAVRMALRKSCGK